MAGEEGTVRSFVAIELPEDVLRELENTQSRLRARLGKTSGAVRWVRPEGTHLTLQFLGEVRRDAIPEIEAAITRAASSGNRVNLTLGALGVFPNPRRPRVLWSGLTGDTAALNSLATLQTAVARDLGALGYRPDKAFSPHLTLGRVRETARPDELALIGELVTRPDAPVARGISFRVEAISLMKSDLQPGGAVYTRLARVDLP